MRSQAALGRLEECHKAGQEDPTKRGNKKGAWGRGERRLGGGGSVKIRLLLEGLATDLVDEIKDIKG